MGRRSTKWFRALAMVPWLPFRLFRNGEAGAWYDPSDLASMFQDSAGTTAVTAAGQSVGLFLDKRLGPVRGPDLTANGDFAGGTTSWTATDPASVSFSVTGGVAQFQVLAAYAGAAVGAQQVITTVSGKWYEVIADVSSSGTSAMQLYAIGPAVTSNNITSGSGKARMIFQANAATTTVRVGFSGVGEVVGHTGTADNFTVREVSGNHLIQATTAAKPVMNAVGGFNYLNPDRFDDFMTASAGGGGTTGVIVCAAINAGGAASARTIWSDRGTNTGYRLSINASNQLVLSAGNGATHTEVIGPTITAGTDYVVTGWHDGVNLNVRADLGAATTAAFATATGGTASFTIARDNGAASGYFGDRINGLVYRQNDASTSTERDNLIRYMAAKQGRTL